MPVGPFESSKVSTSGLQSFQSPTTDTREAFGAHTEKRTPWASPLPSITRPCGPSNSQRRRWVPSPNRWRSSSPIGRATLDITVHSRACLRPCVAARGTWSHAIRTCPFGLPVRPASRVPGRASADAVVGLPAAGDGRDGGARRGPRHESRPGRPRGGRADDRRTDHRHGAGAERPVPGAADRRRPSLAPSRRDGGAHGVGQPCLRQARGDARRPRPVARRMEPRHRARTRLAHRMGRRHARHDLQGAVRVHDARHRADAARRSASARRSHGHQLDRVVARLPGRSIDRADPVHGRTADHGIRTGRRARGPDPQRGRPGAVGSARGRRDRARAARGRPGATCSSRRVSRSWRGRSTSPAVACRTSAA